MPSRDLTLLYPPVRDMTNAMIAKVMAQLFIPLIPTYTVRTFTEQAQLWAVGRTVLIGRPYLTKSPPGHSWHEYGLAVDVVPVIAGKAVYKDEQLWNEIGAIGESVGFRWGGDAGFRAAGLDDADHFQYTAGLKIADALAIFKVKGLPGVWDEVTRLRAATITV